MYVSVFLQLYVFVYYTLCIYISPMSIRINCSMNASMNDALSEHRHELERIHIITRIVARRVALFAMPTAHLRTRIWDFRGFDSSRILGLRGGILMPIGNSRKVCIGKA